MVVHRTLHHVSTLRSYMMDIMLLFHVYLLDELVLLEEALLVFIVNELLDLLEEALLVVVLFDFCDEVLLVLFEDDMLVLEVLE